ncbi:MAG: ferritin-like domain-containing protein, partial [Myroides sp.]
MNILKILDKLSDDKFFSAETSRLDALTNITNFSTKAAIAAIPLGLGTLLSAPAKAATATTAYTARAGALTDALQLALILEYLEDEYYRMG